MDIMICTKCRQEPHNCCCTWRPGQSLPSYTHFVSLESPEDTQPGGDHYKEQAIQPIEYILANKLGYCEGNVVKYITRHKLKNGKEDIEKCIHYLQFILDDQYDKTEDQDGG